MRYDHSVRALKSLIEDHVLGEPVLATIEMRAIPHWMPWAQDGPIAFDVRDEHSSPRHVPILAGRPGSRAFEHPARPAHPISPYRWHQPVRAGIRLGARASGWDDVWAGPAREGAAAATAVRWRFEGTEGLALGAIGWPGWPDRIPSTIDYSTIRDLGTWHRPRWEETWFPDAFAGTMGSLLHAVETGKQPDIPGSDNLKTIALCEAVLVGAREHRVVRLDEFTG